MLKTINIILFIAVAGSIAMLAGYSQSTEPSEKADKSEIKEDMEEKYGLDKVSTDKEPDWGAK